MSEAKLREAIPDVQETIFFCLTKIDELWKQINRLDYALHGPKPTAPECDPDIENKDRIGSIIILERTVGELRKGLIDAEAELRTRLHLLLGEEGGT